MRSAGRLSFGDRHSHRIMPRLKAPPARLGAAPARVGLAAPADENERTRARYRAQPWRKWYATPRWRRLRLQVLHRDGWTCRMTGVPLIGAHPAPDSPVVDHVVPHRGDPVLFWDPANLQALSKAAHDGEKQSMEARGLPAQGGGVGRNSGGGGR